MGPTGVWFVIACSCFAAVILVTLVGRSVAQERAVALRAPDGALLCPLVEDFYSYKSSGSYGPARWNEISECCQGQRQSPRNLLSNSPSLCGRGQQMFFYGNSSRKIAGSLYNNGHDPTISFLVSDTAHLLNAPYTTEPYILDNIHLHFCTDSKGSEHAIDGQFYQSEIHLVHFKSSYRSLGRAVLHEDGIVVIGIMLQSTNRYNRNLNQEMTRIIRKMGGLEGVGKEYQLPIQVKVSAILPSSKQFFTYQGSLTSPPCSESVRWIVLKEPIYISTREMDVLRRLPNEDRQYIAQGCNDRPLQNGNTVVETNIACAYNRQEEELDPSSTY